MELAMLDVLGASQPVLSRLPTRQFSSRDFDETRNHVGQMFCDHDMRLVNHRDGLDARTHSFECRSMTVVDMTYGANVLLQPGSLDDFYLVQIPLSGRARVTIGGREFDCRPGMATIQNPDEPLDMYWDAKCRKLVLRFDRRTFERFVELQYGDVPRLGLNLLPTFELSKPDGAAFASLIRGMNLQLVESRGNVPPSILAHWELCFMSALLLMRAGDDPSIIQKAQGGPCDAVRRVRDYLEANAQNGVDLVDIREIAGIPLRTLHHQFQRSLGITPLQLLRNIRLDRVRCELLRPQAGPSVTTVALNWGFDHLGRFSASYKQRFGETPRETVRRSRAH